MNPIPPATAAKLAAEHPVGTRHKAAMDIAIPLIGNGLSENAVFVQLREKFPPDVTDKELRDIVTFAAGTHPTPSTGTNGYKPVVGWKPAPAAEKKPDRTPIEQVDWWTSGARMNADEVAKKSPVAIPEFLPEATSLVFGTLYKPEDNLNIVAGFTKTGEKANPQGAGKTMPRNDWMTWFEERGIPKSDAGAWFRINPVGLVGSGANGAVTDADVTAFRYVLLESDTLPLSAQLAFYTRLRLPIAVMLLSGGHSAHCWVKVDCADGKAYAATVARLMDCLKPFGIDQANKNPSRLSRLPGAVRKIQAEGDGLQRLIWLNPHAPAMLESDFPRFEESLKFPAIEELPMRAIAERAIPRYEELMANVGNNGVPSGIPDLDKVSGGWKKGHTIVIAGHTGKGKSTLALHTIITALAKGIGVALFSLEMDGDEIFDLMMAHYAKVNRNKFNTGEFVEYDIRQMTNAIGPMSKLPLYIEDSPMLTVDDIRIRVNQLKADNKIGLVVVDYIQFVNSPWTKDTRELQVATISHALRALARESKLPMLVLSQLNDEGRLRESRVISHNANVVMTVAIEELTMTVEIIKGRGIPYGKYTMNFDPMFVRLFADEKPAPTIEPQDDYDRHS